MSSKREDAGGIRTNAGLNPAKVHQIMRYLGIDPGKTSGGIAMIENGRVYAIPMPDTEIEVMNAIQSMTGQDHCFALLEKIQPHYGHDKTGPRILMGFHKLMESYGFLRGVLVTLRIPFDEIQASKWQKIMGCLTHGDKKISKQKAQQLYPGLKITHSTADAILLARCCMDRYRDTVNQSIEDWDGI